MLILIPAHLHSSQRLGLHNSSSNKEEMVLKDIKAKGKLSIYEQAHSQTDSYSMDSRRQKEVGAGEGGGGVRWGRRQKME